MTNEELIEMIQLHPADKKKLMDELWRQNEGLIKQITNKYISPVLNKEKGEDERCELMQQAYIGFDRAVNTFEVEKDFKFTTWFPIIVKREINRYLTNCTHTIRVPVNTASEVAKCKRVINIFEKEAGREPTDFEVSKLLGVSKAKVEEMKEVIQQSKFLSLDEPPKGAEDQTLKLADIIPTDVDCIADATRVYDHKIMEKDLSQALEGINPLYSRALRKRYLDGLTCTEIGKELGITTSRVAEQCAKGIVEIKRFRQRNNLKQYYEIYLAPANIHHVGVASFQRNWTSSTEGAALREIERDKRLKALQEECEEFSRRHEEYVRNYEAEREARKKREWAEMWNS